jgi:hypothetical protein
MKTLWIAVLLFAAGARAGTAQGDVQDILRGIEAGADAGRRTGIVMPVGVAWGSAAALALTDDAYLNNNHVVTALAVNTAISAGLTWLSNVVLPPRPSGEQREFLSKQTTLYVNSWRRGFRETAGKRRFAVSALAVLTGIGVSYLVYSARERPD